MFLMVFSSLTFLCVFLPITFIVYQVLPGIRTKNALLVIVSLIFYAYGEPVYILLMIFSTVLNWAIGYFVDPHNAKYSKSKRKLALAIAVIINIVFLVIFKYSGLFVSTFNSIANTSIPVPSLSLPIGISFYTFQALSYVIDVYRGDVKHQKNYFYVLLYIAFFPQLIAGPIVKYHDIELQLQNRHASIIDICQGFIRFTVGLAKKVLIANVMAVIVDNIYSASSSEINWAVAWIAALAYVLQIYFDFSGYSDMAIGMARMFGFKFKENFNYPYKSSSIKEFWRRWHISLSTWFRDYLYIPLGGNRKSKARTGLNKLIVFATCGLWHGANWTFLVWGLGHGLLLILEEFLPIHKLPKALGYLYSALAVTILFVVFRSDNLGQAGFMISQMFCGFGENFAATQLALVQLSAINITTFIVAVFAAIGGGKFIYQKIENKVIAANSSKATSVFIIGCCVGSVILLVLCVLSLSSGGYNPFIYFRF